MDYKMLFSPMKIGGCEIKNRIVMSPMMMSFADIDGCANEQLMDYYEERAKGGTGLIITEITRVDDKTGAAAFTQLSVSHDYQIPMLSEFARRIHRHGAKLFVQLHHPGRQNMGLLVGTVPISIACTRVCKKFPKLLFKMAPGIGKSLMRRNLTLKVVAPSKCEPSKVTESRVRALRRGEIKKLIREFVEGAVRCKKAGVDGVELHSTHGYLLHQFLSPNTNSRTDEYGGSFDNRLRFLREIIDGIRKECGDYPIIVRVTVDECYDRIGCPDKGYGFETGLKYAKAIAEIGIDAIDVSSAAYDTFNYWLEPTSFDCGWRKYMAAEVKKQVGIPVLAANLIRSPEQAEKQLREGVQDFVSLGRPHIADPHWAEKVRTGREYEIKRCICCLYCMQSMLDNAFVGGHGCCSVNPAVGNERKLNELPVDGNGKTVVIVGAGVGGLTAAELLGRRGFKPVVIEKAREAGGQIRLADKPPKKEKIGWCADDLKVCAELNGAKILFETEATPKLIADYNPYAVIIATGAVAVRPASIPGSDGKNVYTTTEILDGSVKMMGRSVAVVGSGLTGLETAEMLVADNNKVTLVEMADEIAPGAWFQHVDDIVPKLKAAGTRFMTGTKLVSIDAAGAVFESVGGGGAKHYAFDAIVLSLGSRSVNSLAKELEGKYERLFTIGDAAEVGRIADATAAAYDVAVNRI